MQLYDLIFAVWVYLEGVHNPRDVGGGAIYGINERWNPEIYPRLKLLLKQGQLIKLRKLAKQHIRTKYYEACIEKDPRLIVIEFFFKRAWTSPGSRKYTNTELLPMVKYNQGPLAKDIASRYIEPKGVMRRIQAVSSLIDYIEKSDLPMAIR